ncbi:MAG: PDZ domain-containing protein [Anaerolineae bacterium]|nr:PDZ domain-containing protein [Anaerolineae bacterium]
MAENPLPQITLYVSYTSAICLQAIDFFKRRDIEFTVYDVSENSSAMEEMAYLSNQRHVPVIVIGDEVMVGFDMARLRQILPLQERTKVSLGVSIANVKQTDLYPEGAFVGSVKPGSLADRAGVKKGDIITEMIQRPVKAASDVHQVMSQVVPGDPVPLTVWRAGRTLRFTIRA